MTDNKTLVIQKRLDDAMRKLVGAMNMTGVPKRTEVQQAGRTLAMWLPPDMSKLLAETIIETNGKTK